MAEDPKNEHLEFYADGIASKDEKVPGWLIFTYVMLPIWGIIWFYMFWNGSMVPWFDRGYWYELQQAANTTFPTQNVDNKKI